MQLGEACACAAVAISLAALAPAARADPAPPPPAPADDGKPPRPPLPPLPPTKPLAWEQHAEIGTGVAFVEDIGTTDQDGKPTPMRLRPGVGFHVRLAWDLL